jgi:hypothetical protein
MASESRTEPRRFVLASGIVVVAGLTLLSGIIHGRMSNRWGPPRDALAAAEKLLGIPDRVGNWQAHSSDEFSDEVLDMLECIGHVARTYVNEETGEVVNVAVLLGPSGPMSVHTPEICLPSRDYTLHEETRRVAIQDAEGSGEEFWGAVFQANNLEADMLRVCYAWTPGDRWSAPDEPRFTFASSPFLYKIQVHSLLPPQADLETRDPCLDFLRDFVPEARPYLVKAI